MMLEKKAITLEVQKNGEPKLVIKKKKEQLYYSCALFEKDNANNKKTDNCKLLFYKYRKLFWKEETH